MQAKHDVSRRRVRVSLDPPCKPFIDFALGDFPFQVAQLGHQRQHFRMIWKVLQYKHEVLVRACVVTGVHPFGAGTEVVLLYVSQGLTVIGIRPEVIVVPVCHLAYR